MLVVARRAAELERVRAEIEEAGGRAAAYPCDLTDGEAVDALVAQVLAEHGAVDYLVNNAGRSIRRSLHLSDDRFHDFERTMAINYFGPVRLTMGLLPAMREQRFGHVVNIVTWGVQMKAPKFAAYLASKTALDTWSRIAAARPTATTSRSPTCASGWCARRWSSPTEDYDGPAGDDRRAGRRPRRARPGGPARSCGTSPLGVVGEVIGFATPRLMDAVMHRYDRRAGDSAAARRPRRCGRRLQAVSPDAAIWRRTSSMSRPRTPSITWSSPAGGSAPGWAKTRSLSRNAISVGIDLMPGGGRRARCCSSVLTEPNVMSGLASEAAS